MYWFLSRLQSMSFFEIIFRIKQLIQKYYEKAFIMGRSAKMPEVVINNLPIEITDLQNFNITGIVNIFGKEYNYSRGNIQWHTDIFTGEQFPSIFSKSINIRNQPNLSAKVVWEINRMQFLTLIAINYKLKETETDLELFANIIDSWIAQNPYLVGINWYSNIEVNIRLIVWFYCWNILNAGELIKTNEGFKKFAETRWLPTIYQHCKYSYNNPSKYSSSNNHLISEYAGLFIASTLWQFPESKRWNSYAKKGLEKEIIRQHSSNGINREEAAEYIQFITDFFLLANIVGQQSNNAFTNQYNERLKKIIYYIKNFLDKNGNFPKYGDEDDGKCIVFSEDPHFNNFKSIITSGAILFNDPYLKANLLNIDIKNLILFSDKTLKTFDKIKEIQQIPETTFYEKEGHFIFRNIIKNNEIYLHYNAAPLGFLSIAAHGHADALSFILHINGNPFFIDSGTFTYHTEYEWRKYFMGTLAHNTVRINKKNQADIAGPTLWRNHYKTKILKAQISDNIENVVAQHNGYKNEGVTHKREIIFEKETSTIRIIDTIESKAEGQYFLEFPFHLHPNISIKQNNNTDFIIRNIEGNELYFKIDNKLKTSIVKGQKTPQILGWYSKSFMQKEPSNTIYCTTTIKHSQQFQSVITIK